MGVGVELRETGPHRRAGVWCGTAPWADAGGMGFILVAIASCTTSTRRLLVDDRDIAQPDEEPS